MNPIFLTRSVAAVTAKTKGVYLVCGLLLAFACFTASSCSTAHGFGNDVEHVGEKIKEKSR